MSKQLYEDVLIKECIPKRKEIIPMIIDILDDNSVPYVVNTSYTEIQIKNTKAITHDTIEKLIYTKIPISTIVFHILVSIVTHNKITYIRMTAI